MPRPNSGPFSTRDARRSCREGRRSGWWPNGRVQLYCCVGDVRNVSKFQRHVLPTSNSEHKQAHAHRHNMYTRKRLRQPNTTYLPGVSVESRGEISSNLYGPKTSDPRPLFTAQKQVTLVLYMYFYVGAAAFLLKISSPQTASRALLRSTTARVMSVGLVVFAKKKKGREEDGMRPGGRQVEKNFRQKKKKAKTVKQERTRNTIHGPQNRQATREKEKRSALQ